MIVATALPGDTVVEEQFVAVGRVSGLHGVRGWVKVFSYTRPRENIVNYQPWILERDSKTDRHEVDAGGVHGKGVIAHLSGINDRDSAAALVGADILVERAKFAKAAENEFYWTDLEGMEVVTTSGEILGVVDSLMETGANDVLVVTGDRRRLLPFVMQDVVKDVDFPERRLTVDWDPDF